MLVTERTYVGKGVHHGPILSQLLDKDGDGKVTIKELRERAAELSLMGVGDPDSVMNALDADKNGYNSVLVGFNFRGV
jgi:hypothetical protein